MGRYVRVQTGQLSNGITVSYLHLPRCQKFNIALETPVGGYHDPVGKEGLSHILEHTVFTGTESTSEEEFKKRIAMAGGNLNASTGADTTTFDLWASAQNPENFGMIADLMRQILTEPLFESDRVEVEKKVILNERADDLDNLTRAPLKKLDRLLFGAAGKYADIVGSDTSIKSVTADDLRTFMKENYDAGHMHVYAIGPLPFEEAFIVLDQNLSAIPNLGKPKKPRYKPEIIKADERHVRADLHQNYTGMLFVNERAQSLREWIIECQVREHLPMLIAETLRMRHGCFYTPSFGGWSFNEKIGINFFSMSSTPEDSVVAHEALAGFSTELDELLPDDVLNASLDKFVYEKSDPDMFNINIMGDVMDYRRIFGADFDTKKIIEATGRITPEDIRNKAKQILAGLTGIYVQGPKPDLPPALELSQEKLRSALPDAVLSRSGHDYRIS